VLAGGSRERFLISPPPVAFDSTPSRCSPVETFPGAASYPTCDSAMIFRAIVSGVRQCSKAAPLQAMGEAERHAHGRLPTTEEACLV
jgi:hypothetical protein